MRAVAVEHRQTGGVHGLHGAHRVPLDARHLNEAAHRIARQAEVVLHADLGGVLHLLVRAAHDGRQPGGGHAARHAHFPLAADLRRRESDAFRL